MTPVIISPKRHKNRTTAAPHGWFKRSFIQCPYATEVGPSIYYCLLENGHLGPHERSCEAETSSKNSVEVTKNLKGKPLPPGPVTNEQALAAERRMRESA